MRDLSKVFQGVSQANPKYIPQLEDVLRLWWHENRRVFEDRLISDEDCIKVEAIIEREL